MSSGVDGEVEIFLSVRIQNPPAAFANYIFGYFHVAAGFAASMAPANAVMEVHDRNLVAKVGYYAASAFPKFVNDGQNSPPGTRHRERKKLFFFPMHLHVILSQKRKRRRWTFTIVV
jgi:hypothetical protein